VEPHVSRRRPGIRPSAVTLDGRQIGGVDGAEVNTVIDWLAELTAGHRLPQKLLVLHQFRLSMLHHEDPITTARPQVAALGPRRGTQPSESTDPAPTARHAAGRVRTVGRARVGLTVGHSAEWMFLS